jgi:hypothetical protein
MGYCAGRLYPEQVDMTFHEAMFPVKSECLDAVREKVIRKYGSMDSSLRRGPGIFNKMIHKLINELLE